MDPNVQGVIKKFSAQHTLVRFIEIFVSRSFDQIEGHWECESMLS